MQKGCQPLTGIGVSAPLKRLISRTHGGAVAKLSRLGGSEAEGSRQEPRGMAAGRGRSP